MFVLTVSHMLYYTTLSIPDIARIWFTYSWFQIKSQPIISKTVIMLFSHDRKTGTHTSNPIFTSFQMEVHVLVDTPCTLWEQWYLQCELHFLQHALHTVEKLFRVPLQKHSSERGTYAHVHSSSTNKTLAFHIFHKHSSSSKISMLWDAKLGLQACSVPVEVLSLIPC